jgi:DNA-binding NtrC family response regulator
MTAPGNLLVVDDDETVRKLVVTALHVFGYENVWEAGEAKPAVDFARTNPTSIRLLISDICLGTGMNGIQLAKAVKDWRPDIKVLLMSGRAPQPLDLEPAWEFLPKPFATSELISVVQRILDPFGIQVRETTAELTVYTLDLKKQIIPAGAKLEDFRVGPGHEGLPTRDTNVASFHHAGEVFFNLAHEVIGKTRILTGNKQTRAA